MKYNFFVEELFIKQRWHKSEPIVNNNFSDIYTPIYESLNQRLFWSKRSFCINIIHNSYRSKICY